MLEVEVELRNGNTSNVIWYGNENIKINLPVDSSPIILSWTHPGLQAGLAADLGECEDIEESGFGIVAVKPKRRARFERTAPEIQGIYEPGGSVGTIDRSTVPRKTGLKAVKLHMTREQIRAFTSQMHGIMLVTGAPGSGKTTIAYQRIRFLLDQQDGISESRRNGIVYDIDGVHVLLANKNLMHYSRHLLESDLGLSDNILQLVQEFVENYVSDVWVHKRSARQIQRAMPRWEERGRDAVFGLCREEDLRAIWERFESQIVKRLKIKAQMTWAILTKRSSNSATTELQDSIVEFSGKAVVSDVPKKSAVRMDRLHAVVRKQYEALRKSLGSRDAQKFEVEFAKWLYHVYDPLDAMLSFIKDSRHPTKIRIQRGSAARVDGDQLLETVIEDLEARRYRKADHGMIAFLLRFALPEHTDSERRFAETPLAWPNGTKGWSHLVVDEAQDLSAPEAAFLASLVDERGALTISADFRQRVSASHGIENAESILLGCKISTEGMRKPFRFAVNKRQTPEIARFLMAYYEVNFGEVPPFEPDLAASHQGAAPPLPELFLGSDSQIAIRLKQFYNIVKRSSDTSVAVLQVNENPEERKKIEAFLIEIGVRASSPFESRGNGDRWILATVEEIKGLEFDACLVFGFDAVDAEELEFNRNRAYVALSRPAFRLAMICREFPALLRNIPADRYLLKDARV